MRSGVSDSAAALGGQGHHSTSVLISHLSLTLWLVLMSSLLVSVDIVTLWWLVLISSLLLLLLLLLVVVVIVQFGSVIASCFQNINTLTCVHTLHKLAYTHTCVYTVFVPHTQTAHTQTATSNHTHSLTGTLCISFTHTLLFLSKRHTPPLFLWSTHTHRHTHTHTQTIMHTQPLHSDSGSGRLILRCVYMPGLFSARWCSDAEKLRDRGVKYLMYSALDSLSPRLPVPQLPSISVCVCVYRRCRRRRSVWYGVSKWGSITHTLSPGRECFWLLLRRHRYALSKQTNQKRRASHRRSPSRKEYFFSSAKRGQTACFPPTNKHLTD